MSDELKPDEGQSPKPEAKPKAAEQTEQKPAEGAISEAYATRLRNEAAAARKKAEDAEAELKTLKDAADAAEAKKLADQKEFEKLANKERERADKAEKAFEDYKSAANKRAATAEVRAEAREAGILDVDDVSLIDASGVKVDAEGNVTGAKEAVAAFKASKPHKFKDETTTTKPKPETKPRPATSQGDGAPSKKDAADMSPEEFDKAWRTAGRN